ncbi:hypothetical protein LV75_003203 [Actinokineospora diospyrosa]|uniref:Uncharacterized protein n=1 Tax=Actinokineospora diospyrosa TaxID=103728 RepID=A0ABT1IDI9_9PSEU|nr:hypothetical protein [Actinokineospora diospyrosa]
MPVYLGNRVPGLLNSVGDTGQVQQRSQRIGHVSDTTGGFADR